MYNSALSIFTKTVYTGEPGTIGLGLYLEEPNWPVIILFSIGVIAAFIAVSVVLYRVWRKKNCHPIYFAGKVRYARHGATINDACNLNGYGECWLNNRINDLSTQGKIVGLYLDADLTIPLDRSTVIEKPISVYPKLIKR